MVSLLKLNKEIRRHVHFGGRCIGVKTQKTGQAEISAQAIDLKPRYTLSSEFPPWLLLKLQNLAACPPRPVTARFIDTVQACMPFPICAFQIDGGQSSSPT